MIASASDEDCDMTVGKAIRAADDVNLEGNEAAPLSYIPGFA